MALSAAGFSFALITPSGAEPVTAPKISEITLDTVLWRGLAYEPRVVRGMIQLVTFDKSSGPVVYGVDPLGAHAIARFQYAHKKTYSTTTTGAKVLAQLVGDEHENRAAVSKAFLDFLNVAVSTGVLVASYHSQKFVVRDAGASP